jgi:uncharacterized HAD superfamily protein
MGWFSLMERAIGVDLDGVIYKFVEQFDELIKSKGMKVDTSLYSRGLDDETMLKILIENEKGRVYRNLEEYENAVNAVNKLSKKYAVYLITSRADRFKTKEDTIRRVNESGIIHDSIIFSRDKAMYCRNIDLEFFIEDSLSNSREIANNSDTIVYLIDKPYNQSENIKNIIRVKSIEDINI